MNENHRKVLEMLAQGKLSVAEAERIIEKLSGSDSSRASAAGTGNERSRTAVEPGAFKGVKPKFLRVLVTTGEGDDVNVRVPMALIRNGIGLTALLPKQARKAVEAQGVDFTQLSTLEPEEVVEALEDLSLDITDEEGNTVKIYCE